MRRHFARFKDEEIMKHNFAIVEEFTRVAAKSIPPAQLCISWVAALGPTIVPIPGSSYAFGLSSVSDFIIYLFYFSARRLELWRISKREILC